MNLLPHNYSFSCDFAAFGALGARGVLGSFAAAVRARRRGDGASATTSFAGRSDTWTVRCAVRFTMRNARPIGAGRTRFWDGPWFA
jgi:hypothetical protein